MVLSVAGKYAVVTGAGSGINLCYAQKLLERGCSVLIGDLNLRPEAKELLEKYPYRGKDASSAGSPSALFQETDVTSWPQLSRLLAKAVESFPQVDIVCPGAGIFDPAWSAFWQPPRTETNPDTPSRDNAEGEPGTYAVFNVNLAHPIRLSQLAIGYWSQNKIPGTLIHVSSIAGHSAGLGTPLYFASKHGLTGFVRSLGDLRATLGIRVGAIAPGAVMSPMWTEDPLKMAMLEKGGAEMFLEPSDVADAMIDLTQDEQYGDGTILEVAKGGRRVVPLYNADPPKAEGSSVPGFDEAGERLKEALRAGLKV